MKNQYNVIKEKLEQGFFVLCKDNTDKDYCMFTYKDEYGIYSNYWSTSIEEVKIDFTFSGVCRDESDMNDLDLEIVEYFRPNDLFPSKRLQRGDKVKIKGWEHFHGNSIRKFCEQDDLEVYAIVHTDNPISSVNYEIISKELNASYSINEKYVYPRIEKQEEECGCTGSILIHMRPDGWYCNRHNKKISTALRPEDIIGEASLKALQDNGYTITKK